jgi:hypothetical protein
MRLVIKNSIQLCLRTLVFSIVLRHSNYNNRIISIEGTFFGTPNCIKFTYVKLTYLFTYVKCGFSRVLRHSNSNNTFISIVFGFFGTPCTGCIKKKGDL